MFLKNKNKKHKFYFYYYLIFTFSNISFMMLIENFLKIYYNNFYTKNKFNFYIISENLIKPFFDLLFFIIFLKLSGNSKIININYNLKKIQKFFKKKRNIYFLIFNVIILFLLLNIYPIIFDNAGLFKLLREYIEYIYKIFERLKDLKIYYLSSLILVINEEIFFRYYLFVYLLKKLKLKKGILLTSLFFSIIHPFNLFLSFLFSFIFCIILFKNKSLYLIIIFHFLVNVIIDFLYCFYKYNIFINLNFYLNLSIFLIIYSLLIYFDLKYLKK